MNVNPGELNKRIAIVKYISELDEEGFYGSEKEIEIRKCWAKVSNQSGKEVINANTIFSETVKRFLFRYAGKKIDTSMIVKYQGDKYDICYINNYGERNEYIEVLGKSRSQKPESEGSEPG